jgi:hypothetical protein
VFVMFVWLVEIGSNKGKAPMHGGSGDEGGIRTHDRGLMSP